MQGALAIRLMRAVFYQLTHACRLNFANFLNIDPPSSIAVPDWLLYETNSKRAINLGIARFGMLRHGRTHDVFHAKWVWGRRGNHPCNLRRRLNKRGRAIRKGARARTVPNVYCSYLGICPKILRTVNEPRSSQSIIGFSLSQSLFLSDFHDSSHLVSVYYN